jgi:hypothetical protein
MGSSTKRGRRTTAPRHLRLVTDDTKAEPKMPPAYVATTGRDAPDDDSAEAIAVAVALPVPALSGRCVQG